MRRLRRPHEHDPAPFRNAAAAGVPLLLMAALFAELAVVDSPLPAIVTPAARAAAATDPSFELSVQVTAQGYAVSGVASASIPCRHGACAEVADYDTAALTHALRTIKDAHPDQDQLMLIPEADVPYEVLLATMSAAQHDGLFPDVVLSGGAP